MNKEIEAIVALMTPAQVTDSLHYLQTKVARDAMYEFRTYFDLALTSLRIAGHRALAYHLQNIVDEGME